VSPAFAGAGKHGVTKGGMRRAVFLHALQPLRSAPALSHRSARPARPLDDPRV